MRWFIDKGQSMDKQGNRTQTNTGERVKITQASRQPWERNSAKC